MQYYNIKTITQQQIYILLHHHLFPKQSTNLITKINPEFILGMASICFKSMVFKITTTTITFKTKTLEQQHHIKLVLFFTCSFFTKETQF